MPHCAPATIARSAQAVAETRRPSRTLRNRRRALNDLRAAQLNRRKKMTKSLGVRVCRNLALTIAFAAAPAAFAALNPDCTLIVPVNPLTAAGLATPYQLVATNPVNGPCHETNADQAAFVEAAVINLITGQISIYHPLV